MALKRISTRGGVVVVNDGQGDITLTKIEVDARDKDPSKVQEDLESKAGRSLSVQVFYHKNRDGSIAVATGSPPMTNGVVVWPEDQKPGNEGKA